MINVVYITDNNYVIPTQASINSLIDNVIDINDYKIYVIGIELSENMKKRFGIFENADLELICRDDEFSDIVSQHLYVSKAALFKFKLADIFQDLDKILYVDGDVLIQDDLRELYAFDIGNYYTAAVSDMPAVLEERLNKKFNNDNYFNSGVMLLNLNKWREDNVYEKLIAYKKREEKCTFMDQNALNAILGNKTLFISVKYNYMYSNLKKYTFEQIASYFEIDTDEMKDIALHPVILHLTNYVKPWTLPVADKYEEWIRYIDVEGIKYCLPQYYRSTVKEIERLNEELLSAFQYIRDLGERCNNLDAQLQYVRKHTFWGICCSVYDKFYRRR